MFSSADYSVRAGACVGDWRGIQMWRRVHARAHVSSSSKSAQLTPEWVKSGFLREQYPVSAPSLARMGGFFICLFVPEGVKVSDTQQATSSYMGKMTGESLMLCLLNL